MCYKILYSVVFIVSDSFKRSTLCRSRDNITKLSLTVSAHDRHFFTNRIVNSWNSLPDSIVTSVTHWEKRRQEKFYRRLLILSES